MHQEAQAYRVVGADLPAIVFFHPNIAKPAPTNNHDL